MVVLTRKRKKFLIQRWSGNIPSPSQSILTVLRSLDSCSLFLTKSGLRKSSNLDLQILTFQLGISNDTFDALKLKRLVRFQKFHHRNTRFFLNYPKIMIKRSFRRKIVGAKCMKSLKSIRIRFCIQVLFLSIEPHSK